MNFLIDLFRKSIKGDNLRASDPPIKYNDQIAQLNTVNPNQASRLNTSIMNKVQKTKATATQSTAKGTTLPS